jgi:hypothetical protein
MPRVTAADVIHTVVVWAANAKYHQGQVTMPRLLALWHIVAAGIDLA